MILIKQSHLMRNKLLFFLGLVHFDIFAKSKSCRDKNLIRNYYNKKALLILTFHEVIFLSENPNKICDRLRLIFQEKQSGNVTSKIDNEIVAIIDKLLEYKSISAKQHKQILIKFNLLHRKKEK